MIVDDEEMMRDMLSLVFSEEENIEVICCSDGLEALNEFDSFLPDVMVLDLMMPNVDGFEVCRQVREKATANTRIIILSGMAGDDVKDKVIALGANEVYFKPVNIDLLVSSVLSA